MTSPSDLDAVLTAERALQAAVIASDVAALDRLLHPQVTFTGSDGQIIDKATDLASHRTGVLDVHEFRVEELDARIVGDTAVTNVLAQVRGVAASQPFDVRLRYTRAWVRTDDGWVVVAAHASTASG